ncbi:MAG TPA: ATP-binding protein [Cellvibrio sp.]|nr:ATP-binding protein [Cellvibrio sp.]
MKIILQNIFIKLMNMDQIPDISFSFTAAACGLVTTQIDGTIVRANDTFCVWLGFTVDQLLGKKTIQELFSAGSQLFHRSHWAPLLESKESVNEVQVDLICRNGKTLPMLVNVARHKHGETSFDQLAFFVATDRKNYEQELLSTRKSMQDSLTSLQEVKKELHELNEQLSIADRRKDEFLATLAHELRNPLAPMRNVLEIMQIKEANDPFIRWSREIMGRHVAQMTHLVDDLMEASRITQGRLELRKQKINVIDAVQQAIEISHALMKESKHNFTIKKSEKLIIIDADSTRIVQIISNLLTNAVKYTPEGGDICLSVFQEGQDVVLSVLDSGIGIPPEHLSNVFTMFSQLTPALERSQGGLGIGLALVRGLVELHGGSIIARSEGDGKGSEFIVRLPISESTVTEEAAGEKINHPSPLAENQGLRILVVDDNVDAAESLALLLELHGHTTFSANNGIGGFAAAEELNPDVILLDIGLPDISGYEVAQRIRQQSWGEKIILIAATGWGQQKDIEQALQAGFNNHLTKPVDFQKLNILLQQQRTFD